MGYENSGPRKNDMSKRELKNTPKEDREYNNGYTEKFWKSRALKGAPGPHQQHLRCQAFLKKKENKRCKKWATKGNRFCEFHNTDLCKKNLSANGKGSKDPMSKFYRMKLGGALHEYVQQSLELQPGEQLSLLEELALMRRYADDAVQIYQAALESCEKPISTIGPNGPLTPQELAQKSGKRTELLQRAGAVMVMALKQVEDSCKAASNVQAQRKDAITLHDVTQIMNQIVKIAYETFAVGQLGPVGKEMCEQFEIAVRTKIRMPVRDAGGTGLLPSDDAQNLIDLDVEGMDDTVPVAPAITDDPDRTVNGNLTKAVLKQLMD